MSVEDTEKIDQERMRHAPPLFLVQDMFTLTTAIASDESKLQAKENILKQIKAKDMAPFYKHVCSQHGWNLDQNLLKEMETKNSEELKKLEAVIEDANENLGESEIREAHLDKAEYLCTIGEKDAAITAYRVATDKTVSLGHKLDIVFALIRLGMFFGDNDIVTRNLAKANSLMEEGGDWDRRNRLKVYSARHLASMRDFSKATKILLDTVSTFTSYEIMDYIRFVEVTVLLGIVTLPRTELNEKLIKGPEIQEMLHQSPVIKGYLNAYYSCDYVGFFKYLAQVDELLMGDALLAAHRRYYIREMRVRAYAQLLQSYRSVTLESMANSFGVSVDFIDRELSHFIAAKRLNCKIDKVSGIISTNRPDKKNAQYQTTIKQGDLLLNQIQKLSQVVNI